MDQLIVRFGEAAVQCAEAPLLARELFNSTKDAAKKSASLHDPAAAAAAAELELELWDLCVVIVDGRLSGVLGADVVETWLASNIAYEQPPSHVAVSWDYGISDAAPSPETEAFYRHAFDLVLAGEHARALQFAEASKNWFARILLAAESDIRQQPMLHDSCQNLSRSAAGECERAFFGLLCGNEAACVPLCASWKQRLLAHLRCGASVKSFTLEPAADPLARVVLALLQGNLHAFVAEELAGPTPAQTPTPTLARVLVHAQLLMQLCFGTPLNERVLSVYIEGVLAQLEPALLFVPRYVALLPPMAQPALYGRVLYEITSEPAQIEQLQHARMYPELALSDALRCAADLALGQAQFTPEGVERLLAGLNWLKLGSMHDDAPTFATMALYLLLAHDEEPGSIRLTQQFDIAHSGAQGAALALQQQYYTLVAALGALRTSQQSEGLGELAIAKVASALDISVDFGGTDGARLRETRAKWLPIIVARFLAALAPSESSCALDVAIKIADEEKRLYELFDGGLMEKLVAPLLESLTN